MKIEDLMEITKMSREKIEEMLKKEEVITLDLTER